MTTLSSISTAPCLEDPDPYTHRTPADAIAHLRNLQHMRIYQRTLGEFRDMASGGDAGECVHGGSVREYYYPHFTNEDFHEILCGLGESTNV